MGCRVMRFKWLGVVASLAVAGLAVAPQAGADGLGGVSGWSPSTPVCGTQNQIPILFTNATSQPQTGSITVADTLAGNVQVFPSYNNMVEFAQGCSRSQDEKWPGYSYNIPVAPGQTVVYWAALGGVDVNSITNSRQIAVGGLPSGTSGQSWYDFELTMTATQSFSSLQVNYDNTGGTESTTNGQNNFNVVQCSPTSFNPNASSVSIVPTTNILTPFMSQRVFGQIYGWNQPICMGWAPQGTNIPYTASNPAGGVPVTAAQDNGPVVSLAGNTQYSSIGISPTGVTVSYDGGTPVVIPQANFTQNTLYANGYWAAASATENGWGSGIWAIEGIPWNGADQLTFSITSNTVSSFTNTVTQTVTVNNPG